MNKRKKLEQAAAEAAANAASASQTALEDARGKAAEILSEAQKRASVLIEDAQAKAVPAAKDAGVKAADFASRRLDAWEPHIKDALDKVPPAVEAARDKLSDEVLPKIQTMLHDAADHPAVVEATKRGEATVQALKGELEPERPKKSKLRKVGKVLAIGAAVAGAVAAVRHFLTPKDEGWTAHEPSKAYVNNADTFNQAASPAKDEDNVTTADSPSAETEEEQAEETPDSDKESSGSEKPASGATQRDYGEGSYVGDTPPEGFVIKGNERSMKYHVEGTGGYERTIAEVWFNSEEAAQAAGFSKAQR